MPKNLTPAMRAHLDLETTRLAAIWRITRTASSSSSPITTGTSSSAAKSTAPMPGSRSTTSPLDVPDAEDRHNSIGRDLIGQT
jgi:hypothetical protein